MHDDNVRYVHGTSLLDLLEPGTHSKCVSCGRQGRKGPVIDIAMPYWGIYTAMY